MVLFYDSETYRGLTGHSQEGQGITSYPSQWPIVVRDCKGLHRKSLYRRCAMQCERVLQEQSSKLHPLHETFLHFYLAICYESLGEAAHKFSSKKLPLLKQAQNAFMAALGSLPKPESEYMVEGSCGYGHEIHSIVVERVSHQRAIVGPAAPELRMKQPRDSSPDSGYDSASDFALPSPLLLSEEKSSTIKHDTRSTDGGQGYLIVNPFMITEPKHQEQRRQQQQRNAPSPPLPPTPTVTTQTRTYQSNLSILHHLLLSKHLTKITDTIATTASQQTQHKHRRLDQTHRFASFWSFDVAAARSPPTAVRCNEAGAQTHIRTGGTDRNSTNPHGATGRERNQNPKRNRDRQTDERIAKLKREGWVVRKEKYGWKGQAYYERFRAEVVGELSVG